MLMYLFLFNVFQAESFVTEKTDFHTTLLNWHIQIYSCSDLGCLFTYFRGDYIKPNLISPFKTLTSTIQSEIRDLDFLLNFSDQGIFPVVQWLRHHASTAEGMGSVSCWGIKILYATRLWPQTNFFDRPVRQSTF